MEKASPASILKLWMSNTVDQPHPHLPLTKMYVSAYVYVCICMCSLSTYVFIFVYMNTHVTHVCIHNILLTPLSCSSFRSLPLSRHICLALSHLKSTADYCHKNVTTTTVRSSLGLRSAPWHFFKTALAMASHALLALAWCLYKRSITLAFFSSSHNPSEASTNAMSSWNISCREAYVHTRQREKEQHKRTYTRASVCVCVRVRGRE